MMMKLFVGRKTLPKGVNEYQIEKTLHHYKNIYDPHIWNYYKIEMDNNEQILRYVLRSPMEKSNPFRVILAEFLMAPDLQWIEDAVAFRLSFLYKPEIKQNLGMTSILERAIKKYGSQPSMQRTETGFEKIYVWEDGIIRIELGFGYQYDRLRFTNAKYQPQVIVKPKKQVAKEFNVELF